ncbi:MAG: hypothetical protein AAGA80_24930 [Cyanobacteria bacterium P01_F01_bin.143]
MNNSRLIDIEVAKDELIRINNILNSPKLLIGGLAVQRYIAIRDSKDIDLVCSYNEAQNLVKTLYPTNDWNIKEVKDDFYKPSFLITHQYENFGSIIFGPKITERTTYNFINWDKLIEKASPYILKSRTLKNILIPNCSGLAYTKLIAFLGRDSEQNAKRLNDLQDFTDLSNQQEFSLRDFINLIKQNKAEKYISEHLNFNSIEAEIFNKSSLAQLKTFFHNSSIDINKASLSPINLEQAKQLREDLQNKIKTNTSIKDYKISTGICLLDKECHGINITVICDPPMIPDYVKQFLRESTQGYCKISIQTDIMLLSNKKNLNPSDKSVRIGSRIFGQNHAYGTLGCFVKKRDSGSIFILSCSHVLGLSNSIDGTSQDAEVFIDDSSNEKQSSLIARDVFYSPLEASPLAMARLLPEVVIGTNLSDLDEGFSYANNIVSDTSSLLGKSVFRLGHSNKMIKGVVSAIELDITFKEGQKSYNYSNIVEIKSLQEEPFARPGDSGSLVMTEDKKLIGLIFAGSANGYTYTAPIATFLDSLNLVIST